MFKNLDGSIQVSQDCFNGTLEEFEKAVKSNHKGTKYEKEYLALIDFIRCRFGEFDNCNL